MKKKIVIGTIILVGLVGFLGFARELRSPVSKFLQEATSSIHLNSQPKQSDSVQGAQIQNNSPKITSGKLKILKDVGEAYMDYFGLTENDFKNFKQAGFNTLEGNFDICATDEDVRFFLDMSQKYGMKVIMPAGSGEAEWGYACEQSKFLPSQKPNWSKDAVVAFVKKWKGHQAVYGWDTSNEAGSVLPNANQGYYLTAEQLKTAYKDVKEADNAHPVMIRQNGWFYYENKNNPFIAGNPFVSGMADVVMVNAYSNVEDYYADLVPTITKRAQESMLKIDSHITITVSVGVWEEKPLWFKPSVDHVKHDLEELKKFNLLGIAYFKYGAKGSEWYLPESAPELWKLTSQY